MGPKGVEAYIRRQEYAYYNSLEEPLTSMNDMFVLLKSAEAFNSRNRPIRAYHKAGLRKEGVVDADTGAISKALYSTKPVTCCEVTFSRPVPANRQRRYKASGCR